MNKSKMVLDWLKTHAGITSMEAFENFGATRLSAIIFELKRKGYDIETVMVDGRDRYGNRRVFEGTKSRYKGGGS